jgi:hypothetical protein
MYRMFRRVFLVLLLSLLGDAAMAVEEPPFQSILIEDAIEIRDYPALAVAEVTVPGEQKEAGNQGFRILAAYIFGNNKRREEIPASPSTAQQESNQKIAMTAPVTQTRDAGEWVVRFTMPTGSSLETLPEPKDERVHLRMTPPARFAVVRFSGLAYPEDVASKVAELRAWIDQRHLRAAGPPSLAQYNPPWIPWFMRRNEVMIQLEH